jgi:putative heme iron utilization protein
MSEQPIDPVRPTDDDARALARSLIEGARFGALGVTDPDTAHPMVTRIAVVPGPDGAPLTLISSLSSHTQRSMQTRPVRSSGESRGPRATH